VSSTRSLSISVDNQTEISSVVALTPDMDTSMSSVLFGQFHANHSFGGCIFSFIIGQLEVDLIDEAVSGVNIGKQ